MINFAYSGYVEKISKRIKAETGLIEARWGFKIGRDFEVVVCKLLRAFLPQKFGIIKGFAVSFEGEAAGDDIIIYDKQRFPTLFGRSDDEILARDEEVPIEAVYAYIELKSSINLIGDKSKDNSLRRGISQVKRVTDLCGKREDVPPNQVSPNFSLGSAAIVMPPPDFPSIRNPMFSMLISNRVRKNRKFLQGKEAHDGISSIRRLRKPLPNVMVLGDSSVVLPTLPPIRENRPQYGSPFYLSNSKSSVFYTPETAMAIGFVALMQALEWIQLGKMPYKEVIGDAINKFKRD